MISRSKVTLKSIAADLGITHTSVSNAFNNPAKVSEKLRQKIMAYAKSVDYHGPNPAARSLRTGLYGAIGIIFNDQLSYAFSDPHDIAFLRGISSVCEQQGTNLVLIPLKNNTVDDFEPLGAMVDGFILNAPYSNNPTTKRALARELPTVVVDFDSSEHISVLTNDSSMMAEMTQHILSLGHRHIGIVTFPIKEGSYDLFSLDKAVDIDNYVVNQRISGCKQAISKTDIKMSSILIQETINSEDGGASAARQLLDLQPDITALICFSDRLAYGAMAECKLRGLKVPERISVTGFDDILPLEQYSSLPGLTTVRQDAYEKGVKAAQALLKKNEVQGQKINIEAQVIIRESSAQLIGVKS